MDLFSRNTVILRLPFLSVVLLTSLIVGCATSEPGSEAKEDELIGVQLNIATNQLDLGQPDRALQTLKPLISNFPNNSNVLILNGMVHLALSNPSQALIFLRRAYDQEPSTASGLNLSSALIAAGQQVRARNVLRKLLKNDENYPFKERLLHNIGISYQKERNFPAAKKYLRQSLENNPGYYMSLIVLAKVEKETGNHAAAKEQLLRAVKACPSCYEPVHLLATAYINNNETKLALSMLRNFDKNDDASPEDKESALQLWRYLESRDPLAVKAAQKESQSKKNEAYRDAQPNPVATENDSRSSY